MSGGHDDGADEVGGYSIIIDDPVGPRSRAPTDTTTPAAPPRRSLDVAARRMADDADDTGPLLVLREALDRGVTPPLASTTLPLGGVTPPDFSDGPTPTAPVPAHRPAPFGPPIVVERAADASSGTSRRPLSREPSRPRPGTRPVRDYPVLRGLVRNPDAAAVEERPLSTTTPRAFVRAGAVAEPRSARAEVDELLGEMAEGLLVGGDGAGTSEIRVTLGEEFFGGTELRIQRSADGVTAILRPPDRDTYRILAAELPRLRVHLEERGLRVSNLRVEEP
jgi:hypothetical protein